MNHFVPGSGLLQRIESLLTISGGLEGVRVRGEEFHPKLSNHLEKPETQSMIV